METELRNGEHAVGAEPDQFRLLVESVSDYAIYLLDKGGHVRSWNVGVQRIKGYTAADVLGRHYSMFYTAEDREAGKPLEVLRQAEREGRVRAEGWRLRKDGSRFWADVVVTALRGRSGELTGFAKVTHDMTGIHHALETLSRLSRRLVEAEEAERRRIARELHDRVGQNLSALNINLDIVLGMLGEQAQKEVRVRLRDSLALVDGTLQTIENVMADLRPPLLDEYGLGAALGWHAEEFVRRTHLRVDFEDRAKERTRALRQEDAVTLFRIAQEALNNVAKHAQAAKVWIGLSISDHKFILELRDDGRGFDPAAPTSRLGMRGMRERAEAAGAAFEVESAPGKGTMVRIGLRLPE